MTGQQGASDLDVLQALKRRVEELAANHVEPER